jgi:hypothetical protein
MTHALAAVPSCCRVAVLQLILVASAAVAGMGMGPFFTLLAGLNLLTTGTAAVQIFRHREHSREMIRVASMAGTAAAAAAAAADDDAGDSAWGSAAGSSGEDCESGSAAAAAAAAAAKA